MAILKCLVLFTFGMAWACFPAAHAVPTDDEAIRAQTFLQNFGYSPKKNMMGPNEIKESDTVKQAITNFQKFYGMRVTGEIDAETLEQMDKPRCGVPDPTMPNEDGKTLGGKLIKRYAFTGDTWRTNPLTYSIVSYPGSTSELTKSDVDAIIAVAFKIWSDVTPLVFQEVQLGSYADIYLSFGSYSHGDYYPFDGPNGVLAHAYSPGTFEDLAGDVHFDDSERFTQKSYYGYNLLQVAAHEIGHSLGLGHSSVAGALMYPSYQGYQPSFSLPEDDTRGIQALYGKSGEGPKPTYTSGDVEGCNKAYSAIGFLRYEIFAFQNDKYWRIPYLNYVANNPEGEDNKYFWYYDLPSNVDAVYERPVDGKIIFFKDDSYYIFNGNVQEEGPLDISSLTEPGKPSLPNGIDAVLTYYEFQTTYFFKDDLVWRYNEERKAIDPGYPISISLVFPGVPDFVTAAFRYGDGSGTNTYFVKGKQYYRYDDRFRGVDYGYPRLFGVDFLGCTAETIVGDNDDNNSAAVSISNVLFLVVSSLVSVLFVL